MPQDITIKNEVLHLWRVTYRHLSITASGRDVCSWNLASSARLDEKQVVAEARSRFSEAWWRENILVNVEYIGDLRMVAGQPLFEDD